MDVPSARRKGACVPPDQQERRHALNMSYPVCHSSLVGFLQMRALSAHTPCIQLQVNKRMANRMTEIPNSLARGISSGDAWVGTF